MAISSSNNYAGTQSSFSLIRNNSTSSKSVIKSTQDSTDESKKSLTDSTTAETGKTDDSTNNTKDEKKDSTNQTSTQISKDTNKALANPQITGAGIISKQAADDAAAKTAQQQANQNSATKNDTWSDAGALTSNHDVQKSATPDALKGDPSQYGIDTNPQAQSSNSQSTNSSAQGDTGAGGGGGPGGINGSFNTTMIGNFNSNNGGNVIGGTTITPQIDSPQQSSQPDPTYIQAPAGE